MAREEFRAMLQGQCQPEPIHPIHAGREWEQAINCLSALDFMELMGRRKPPLIVRTLPDGMAPALSASRPHLTRDQQINTYNTNCYDMDPGRCARRRGERRSPDLSPAGYTRISLLNDRLRLSYQSLSAIGDTRGAPGRRRAGGSPAPAGTRLRRAIRLRS